MPRFRSAYLALGILGCGGSPPPVADPAAAPGRNASSADARATAATAATGTTGPLAAPTPGQLSTDAPHVPAAATAIVMASASCARVADGSFLCWGYDSLIDPTHRNATHGTPVPEPLLKGADEVALGDNIDCFRRGGEVSCWSPSTGGPPAVVPGLAGHPARQIAVGTNHACAVTSDGSAYCWGANSFGALGRGVSDEKLGDDPTARPVAGLRDVVEVAAGGAHSCARLRDGHVRCWGQNEGHAITGASSAMSINLPVTIPGIDDAVALSIPPNYAHACALRQNGALACWGREVAGEMGSGRSGERSEGERLPVFLKPIVAKDLPTVLKVASADTTTCVVVGGGTVMCFGDNTWGEAGTGVRGEQIKPTVVPGLTDVIDVKASATSICALERSGVVKCWGKSEYGALGNPSADGKTPRAVDL